MMNEYQMKLEEGNKVTLPESLVNKLLLRKGETVCLIQEDGIKDKCFKVTAENEKELFDEDFYCIPKRVFDMCHLDYESIQIIVEQGQMVITNPQYVLSYLGKDMITCLLKQNVDLGLFAKDLVDLLNVIQQAWKQMESQIKNIVNNVVFPVIDIILAVFFFAKLAMAYFDYRKQGQFDWTTPAILFACLTFSLIAPNYIWKVL